MTAEQKPVDFQAVIAKMKARTVDHSEPVTLYYVDHGDAIREAILSAEIARQEKKHAAAKKHEAEAQRLRDEMDEYAITVAFRPLPGDRLQHYIRAAISGEDVMLEQLEEQSDVTAEQWADLNALLLPGELLRAQRVAGNLNREVVVPDFSPSISAKTKDSAPS